MKNFDFDKEIRAFSQENSKKTVRESNKSISRFTIIIVLVVFVGIVIILMSSNKESKHGVNKSNLASDQQVGSSATENKEILLNTQSPSAKESDVQMGSVIKSLRLTPTNPTITDVIKADVELAEKERGDRISLKYQWLINNTTIIEGSEENTLQAGKVKRGDYVSVRVLALRDGQMVNQVNSDMYKVQNSPPSLSMKLISKKIKRGEPIEIQLSAIDPDGDKLVFSLEDPPSGMTIDSSTGRIIYRPQRDGAQSVSFKASVTDPEGAKASGVFEVQFSEN